MNTMRAAIFEGNGIVTVRDVPVPEISRDTQLILEVEAASICGSDLHGLAVPPAQYMKPGIIYGHEFTGRIVKKGAAVSHFSEGDRVVVNPRVRCGTCYECTHQIGDLCSHSAHYGQTADGGFAEYARVDVSQLYKIDDTIQPEIAAQAEPLACVMSGISAVKPDPRDHVLLYGAGPIGLTFLRVLKRFGIRNLIVTAKGERRIQKAKSCGADVVVDVSKESVRDVMERLWPYHADVVIDAVGRGSVLEEALPLLNPHGRMLLFGFDKNARAEISPAMLTEHELTLCGAMGKDFPGALEMLADAELGLERFITHRLPLEEIHEGIRAMKEKEACRVIICPNGIPG